MNCYVLKMVILIDLIGGNYMSDSITNLVELKAKAEADSACKNPTDIFV